MSHSKSRGLLPVLLLTLLVGSCSEALESPEGGEGGAELSAGVADLLVRPTLVPELFSFSAVIDELRLVEADGTTSENLLLDPLPLEFLHLADTHAWLSRTEVDTSTDYTAVAMSFVPDSYEAVLVDGTPLEIEAQSDGFQAPIVGGMGDVDYTRVQVLFELRESLNIDLDEGTATLAPQGLAELEDGTEPLEIDSLLGLVRSRDTGSESFEIDAFASQELRASIGSVGVRISPLAGLVGTDNTLFFSAPFFLTYLTPGATLVDVLGSLGENGEFLATRVELEDQVPIVGGVFPVVLEGRVLEVGPNFGLRFQLRSIPRGRELVQPYLDGLEDPGELLVTYDPILGLFFVGQNSLVSPASLAAGQDLTIKFKSFQGEPFASWRMDIRSSAPGLAGVVGNTAGLPESFELLLDGDPPAIVSVSLDETSIVLDTLGLPQVAPEALRTGLEAVAFGIPVSSPTGFTIAPSLLQVVPGRLVEARVGGAESVTRSLQTLDGIILDSFGDALVPGLAGPVRVLVDEGTLILGDANSIDSLFERLAEPGTSYTVEVAGISTGGLSEALAYTLVLSEVE